MVWSFSVVEVGEYALGVTFSSAGSKKAGATHAETGPQNDLYSWVSPCLI